MKYSELANYLEKLEETSSRLTLIELLSELFKEVDEVDVDKIVYLLQGRIAPFFAPIEIGMAEKNVAGALSIAYGVDRDEVLRLNGELGDMGLAALQLSQKSKVEGQKLTVGEAFNILHEIAGTSGEGSVEKKQIMLSDLLKQVDSVAAKHLVRVPLGKTRLGIGDPTVLDALATAKLGDKTKRKVLEGAYNRTSDLGLIARVLWSDGLEAVEKLQVRVGFPIRSELCERLPNPEKVIEKMGEVDVQYKYDGFRVQIHKNKDEVRMFSRNLEDMSHMFPELKQATLDQVKANTIILDTEALAYNPESEEFLPFQETTKRRRKHGIEEMAEKLPLRAFVFDILYKDGESLIDRPLHERMKILEEVIKEDDVLIRSKNQTMSDPKEMTLLLEDAISKGLEGLVVKKLESPYVAGGRNFNWVKLKRHSAGDLHDTIDCVILGYIFGRGKRAAFGAGALLVGVYDDKRDEFVTVSKIGTGLTDEEWISIKEKTKGMELDHKPARVDSLITPSVWVKPDIVIEVLADEITRSPLHTAGSVATEGVEEARRAAGAIIKEPGYALRFPRLVSFRDKDKKAEDATTVEELIEMYNQQGKK
jgi:DNA ligase-1